MAFKPLPEKRSIILWCAAVFLTVFVVYVLCPVSTSTDSRWTFYFSMSLLREGNQDLDEYSHLMEMGDFRVTHLNGHIYSYFPLAVALVNVPYVWAVDQLFPLYYGTDFATYLRDTPPNANRLEKLELISASLISALAAAAFFLLARTRLDQRRAFALTLIFAFATPMLSTASRALWQHGLSVLCLTAALFLLTRFSQHRAAFFFAGLLLGFAYVVRPTNSVSVFFLTVYVLVNHRQRALLYFIGLLIPLAALMLNSWSIYQTLLPPYYLPQRVGTNVNFFNALLANLISPNRGLFVSSPVVIFSLWGIYLTVRKNRADFYQIEIYLAAILILHWAVISSFDNWYGGWSLGARFLTDMTPYLVYFLIPIFEQQILWAGKRMQVLFALALTVSALTHFRYATSIYPMLWNASPVPVADAPWRVWSVRDLQIFRGTCKNELRGQAPQCWFKGKP